MWDLIPWSEMDMHEIHFSRLVGLGKIHLALLLTLFAWKVFLLVRKLVSIQLRKNCPAPLRDYVTVEEYREMRKARRATVIAKMLLLAISLATSLVNLTSNYNKFVWELTALYVADLSHRAMLFPILDGLIIICVKTPIRICQFFVFGLPSGTGREGFFMTMGSEAFQDVVLAGAWSSLVVHLTDKAGLSGYWMVFGVYELLKLNWMFMYVYWLQFTWYASPGYDEAGIALKNLADITRFKEHRILLDPRIEPPSGVKYLGVPGSEIIIVPNAMTDIIESDELQGFVCHTIGHIVSIDKGIKSFFASLRMFAYLTTWVTSYNNATMKRIVGFRDEELHPFVVPHLVHVQILPTYLQLIGGIENLVMRRREFAADEFAVKHGFGAALRSGLLKLTAKNLVDTVFDSWYSAWYYGLGTSVERATRIGLLIDDEPPPEIKKKQTVRGTVLNRIKSDKSLRKIPGPSSTNRQEPPADDGKRQTRKD